MAILDVVNEHDEVIGEASYEDINAKHLTHRVVCVILVDSQYRIYIQQRSLYLDLLPGRWDMSASGHVDRGETYERAAERELREELGFDDFDLLHIETYYEEEPVKELGALNHFSGLFEARYHGEHIELEEDEVGSGRWISQTELEDWLQVKPDDFTPSARTAYKKYKEAG